jgi:hypothetical protein
MQNMVSERALSSRIDRALRKNGEKLRRCRSNSRDYHRLGDFYTVDIERNAVASTHVDLEQRGRELGVLHSNEQFAR